MCVCVYASVLFMCLKHIDTLHYYSDMHWYNPMDENTHIYIHIYIYIYIAAVGALVNLRSIYFKIGKKRNNKLPKDGRRKTPLIILSFQHHF